MRHPNPPEADPPKADPREAGRADERAELARHIDQLMAQPARGRPAVTVVGDDAVFAIWPALPQDRPVRRDVTNRDVTDHAVTDSGVKARIR